MVTPVVVDSSVVYKMVHAYGEDHVAKAIALLEAHRSRDIALVAPHHLLIELANSLGCSPRLSPQDVDDLIAGLAATDIGLIEVTIARLRTATELAYRHNLSVYDALFLQLAIELDCPLVTADRKAFAGIDSPVEIRVL